jgi:hypothetical protein
MQSDLQDLHISARDIQQYSRLAVNDTYVGGLLGGTYRFSVFRQAGRLLGFCLTEFVVAALILMFSLPIGLAIARPDHAIHKAGSNAQFALIVVGVTALVMIARHLHMYMRARSLKLLMNLLDEIDHFHQVLSTVDVLDQLSATGNTVLSTSDRSNTIEALQTTRNSLVAGLMTENILRNDRGRLTRHPDLLANLEHNSTLLKTLEIRDRASEYGNILHEALQIGIRVQAEAQTFYQWQSEYLDYE